MPVKIDQSKCTGCAKCVDICPSTAIQVESEKASLTGDCIDCYACVNECESQAIASE